MSLLGRNTLFGTAVMAAFGLPYAMSDRPESATSSGGTAIAEALTKAPAETVQKLARDYPALRPDAAAPWEGPAVVDLAEVVRFDVSPSWVIQRWPRVMNNRHGSENLQAYRVPLVTGPKAADLAGSLTYYFDESPTLQGIQFVGTTGDTAPLEKFLTQQHGLKRQKSSDPGQVVYEQQRDGKAVSQLLVKNFPVIDASLPQTRYRVEFVLQRPSDHKTLSEATGHRFDGHRWP